MNVGAYVRTKDGKIVKCFKSESMNKPIYYVIDSATNGYIEYQDVIKSSPNILKLLEPMDLLYVDIDGGFEGGIIVPRIPETQNELNGFIEFIKSGQWILKGVVTHEQLKSRIYEVK